MEVCHRCFSIATHSEKTGVIGSGPIYSIGADLGLENLLETFRPTIRKCTLIECARLTTTNQSLFFWEILFYLYIRVANMARSTLHVS